MTQETYRTERETHGHVLSFGGGEGHTGIDVSYDGGPVVDRINTFIYLTDKSCQLSRQDFLAHVDEYLGVLTAEDAHLHASGGRA